MNNTIQLLAIITAILLGSVLVWAAVSTRSVEDEPHQSNTKTETVAFRTISPAEFSTKLNTGAYTTIDIRTPEEIAEGKITADALELDFYAPDFKQQLAALPKDQPYLIYCRSGNRSDSALSLMKQLGFEEAYDLAGGKTAWQASGGTLTSGGSTAVSEETPPKEPDQSEPPSQAGSGDQLVACTMEAKICPDGSAVGRTGPNCEFTPCPGE